VSWTQVDLGSALNHARRPDEARAVLSRVIEADPMLPHAHRLFGLALVQLGKLEDAVAEFRKTVELTGGEASALAQLGWACGVAGHRDEARRLLDRVMERCQREYVDPLAIAWLHIGLGDADAAFSWLERAYEARSSWLIFLKVHQIYEPLHSDPRYRDLVHRLGLPS
jgi:Flp pilus assembly protein TadD